jgi:putative flippase GtrA
MTRMHLSGRSLEFLRFAAVAVAGLVVDISLAWTLSAALGIDLVLAAAAGFAAGAVFNYLLHEFWTFRRAERAVSSRRMIRYGVALGVTLGARLGVVYGLSRALGAAQSDLAILLCATVLSFFVNYLMSKLFVFQAAPPPETASEGSPQ